LHTVRKRISGIEKREREVAYQGNVKVGTVHLTAEQEFSVDIDGGLK